VRRIALAIVLGGALLIAGLAGIIARPSVLVLPLNVFLLSGKPIMVVCESAQLEMPWGWKRWHLWRWRVKGFAIISRQQGLPTFMADEWGFRMPDWKKSWETGDLVIPKAMAKGFTVFIPQAKPPPPFVEKDAWPLKGVTIEQGVLFGFSLLLKDPSGLQIVIDDCDGQVLDFRYDIGHREMFGHGDSKGGGIRVGPLGATNLRAIPIDFTGRSMLAKGYGSLSHERAQVVFGIDGLFRARAKIHAEFVIEDASVRQLLLEALGDDAPEMDGRLWADAVIDTNPPNPVTIGVSFRLVDGQMRMPDETKDIILAGLKVAPFVQLKDKVAYFGEFSGNVSVKDGAVTLHGGKYVAAASVADVDARMTRESLRGRVHFVPEPGAPGLNWGILIAGTAKKPQISLADKKVLEAWNLEEDLTADEIRAEVKEDEAEMREVRRGERKRRGGGKSQGETDSATPDDGTAPAPEGEAATEPAPGGKRPGRKQQAPEPQEPGEEVAP